MNKRSRMSLLSVVFIIVILACNISTGDLSQPDLALTITAQALILQQNGQAPAAVNPPAADAANPPAAENANPPAASAATSTATSTVNSPAAGGPVTVTVSVETNCRQGPNISFPSVYSMSVSDVAEVIGKNTFTNYWIIKIPNGGGSICWLWGKYATIKGDPSTLAEFATPTPKATATSTKTATPTATITSSPVPNAPSGLKRTVICTASVLANQFDYGVSIIWVDNSNDENNFNVFTNSSLTPLGANTTSFNFTETYPTGTTLTISVTAQNGAGSSAPITTTVVCP